MITQTHSGPHLCPSLTRVRQVPALDRGQRAEARRSSHHELPKLSAALPSALANVQASDMPRRTSSSRNRKTDNIEYRVIFAGAFAVFFVAAVFERALPTKWATAHGNAAVKKPIVEQAKEAASISAGYAFMG
jgi:hypothetical protein